MFLCVRGWRLGDEDDTYSMTHTYVCMRGKVVWICDDFTWCVCVCVCVYTGMLTKKGILHINYTSMKSRIPHQKHG